MTENFTHIFDLSHAQLQPVAEAMAGEFVADFTVTVEREPQGFPGWTGDKIIPTFRWRTSSGQAGETITCVKRLREPWMQEARHYAYLHKHGFPAVGVYGVTHEADGREILFLEYLDRFWPGGNAPQELRRPLLEVRAWLNALPIAPEYAASLWNNAAGQEWLEPGTVEHILTMIWDVARTGDVGEELRDLCWTNEASLPGLASYARDLSRRIATMPRALSNGELCPGSPPGLDTLRCFDMHSMCLAPRFSDLVPFLAIPAGIHTLWGSPSWEPRQELAAHYANELARHGGPEVSAQTVLDECEVLWQAQAFNQEWTLGLCRTGQVVWTADREQGKAQTRAALHSQLSYLLKRMA